jgi:tetratricopeptide (TPR) repeat protein
MTRIRAFVGHSFATDDEGIVNAFLKYFDSLSRSSINFTWTHAEPAEPKALAAKVTVLLAECNVFIGVCTRKERVIAPNSLSETLLLRGFMKGSTRDFLWKTSDWIIQEIGLAIGKEMNLILLLESDVQEPGGLQGDIEYIRFNRDRPADSFQKIFEMISAISPKAASVTALPDTRSPPSEDKKEALEPRTDENWWIPQPGWSRRRHEVVLNYMVEVGDEDKAKAIYDAYLTTEHANQSDNKQSWEAYLEYLHLRYGRGGSIAKLKTLAETHPNSARTWEMLAKGLADYDDHVEAGKTYETAAQKASGTVRGLILMGDAALEHSRSSNKTKSSEIVDRMRAEAASIGDGELVLLSVLDELAKIEKRDDEAIGVMERLVELQPDNDNIRFSLAYKHSEMGHNDLALLHYLKIREQTRGGGTWNNLGVAFEEAGLPAKAVNAYRQSKQLGETLAMSNLAHKFMSAGFLSEAEQECENALKMKDFHQNVATTLADLKSVSDREQKTEAELLGKARPLSDFYKQFGRAVSKPGSADIATRWNGPQCELLVRIVGGKFEATGSYEESSPGSTLVALTNPFAMAAAQSKPDRYHVKYIGTCRGNAIEGTMSRTLEDDPTKIRSLLSSAEYKTRILMVLTDDCNEIRVMEKPERSTPRFHTLTRKAS